MTRAATGCRGRWGRCWLTCAVLSGLLAPGAAIAQGVGGAAGPGPAADPDSTRVLAVGILDDVEPFSFLTRYGYRAGFDFELARALCERLPVQCTFRPLRGAEVVDELVSRQLDVAVASLSITPELEERVDFTAPYFVEGARFVVRDGEGVTPQADGAALTYGAVRGTPHAAHLLATVKPPGRVILFEEAEGMWLTLALGRIDAALTAPVIAREGFLSTPLGEGFTLAPGIVHDEKSYGRGLGIAVRNGDEALRVMFDEALATFMKTEAYAALKERYLDQEADGAAGATRG